MTIANTITATAPIVTIFAINNSFVPGALDGLTDKELWSSLTPRNNTMLWVAGHVVQTRAMILQILGEPVDTGWGKLFDRGATVGESSQYPSGGDIVRVMAEITPRLMAKLASLDDETLAKPATIGVPGTQTLADELAFFALHDAYHIGQMVYIRKGLGYPGLAG